MSRRNARKAERGRRPRDNFPSMVQIESTLRAKMVSSFYQPFQGTPRLGISTALQVAKRGLQNARKRNQRDFQVGITAVKSGSQGAESVLIKMTVSSDGNIRFIEMPMA